MNMVDRPLNPKAKSLGNRQRFLRRAKAEIRESVRDAIKRRKVSEVEGGEKVRIRSKSLREPSFGLRQGTGKRDHVLPGNRNYSVGDVIRKPEGGAGGSGSKGSPDGEGEDDFVFQLTREEFLDLFFEDLKLPNLVKAKLKSLTSPERQRAGLTSDGSPSKLNKLRTMRNSLARRIALRRPRLQELQDLEALIASLEAEDPRDEGRIEQFKREALITARLNHLNVIKLFSTGEDHGYFYIAMELVGGGSLEQLMKTLGKLPEEQALKIGREVAEGLRNTTKPL